MLKKKLILGMVLFTIVIGGMMMSYGKGVEVETLVVENASFEDIITEDGVVVAIGDWKLYSEVEGLVVEVFKEEGDYLQKGDAIAQIDTSNLKLKRRALQGQLIRLQGEDDAANSVGSEVLAQEKVVKRAKAVYDQCVLDVSRGEALYTSGALSQQDLENLNLKMIEAKAALAMQKEMLKSAQSNYSGQLLDIQSQIELLDKDIEKCTLRSSGDGYLADFDLTQGDGVSVMQEVGRILSDASQKIETMVLADQVYGLCEGQGAHVVRSLNGSDELVDARIVAIVPSAVEVLSPLGLKEKRVKVELICNEEMTPALITGSDIDVEFIIYEEESVIVVPRTAVFYTESGDALWLLDHGKATLHPIKTGYETSKLVEVTSGLSEGDEIIKYYDSDDVEAGAVIK